MADMTFLTDSGATIERKMMIAYLNTGEASTPVWSAIGKRVEDSSVEYDWQDEDKNDILGDTYSTMKKPIVTQTFEPCELDAADAAQLKVWNLAVKDQDAAKLCNLDMLIVHAYAGTPGKVFAERYSSCKVKPSGLGGSSTIGMPIDVTYGGKRTTGTAAVAAGVVTFTADT